MSGTEFDGVDFDETFDDEEKGNEELEAQNEGGEGEPQGGNTESRKLRMMREGEFRKSENDLELEGGYRLPYELNENLFEYQRTGVRWLWELYSQRAGGIIGDEMVVYSFQEKKNQKPKTNKRLFTMIIIIIPNDDRAWGKRFKQFRSWGDFDLVG
jgi:hypothetical protein